MLKIAQTDEAKPRSSARTPCGAPGTCAERRHETLLGEIWGVTETERLLLVHVDRCEGSGLVIRQQSWAPGLGWFTQSSVEVRSEQLESLRRAIGRGQPAANQRPLRETRPADNPLRIVS